MIYIYIIYISKEDFLSVFITVFCIAITELNIRLGFYTIELILYDSEYIISQLDIRLCMPTPALTLSTIWKPKILHNIFKLQSQSIYLKDRIVQYQNSLSTKILKSLDQAIKGATNTIYKLTLLQKKVIKLCKANNLLSQCRYIKKRYIQEGGILIVEDVQNSEAQREANI